jgi:hypothetical protein
MAAIFYASSLSLSPDEVVLYEWITQGKIKKDSFFLQLEVEQDC